MRKSTPKPMKKFNIPKKSFTIEEIVAANIHQSCELSIRNKISAAVRKGTIIRLKDRKPKGVGRPIRVFRLKDGASRGI